MKDKCMLLLLPKYERTHAPMDPFGSVGPAQPCARTHQRSSIVLSGLGAVMGKIQIVRPNLWDNMNDA